MKPQHTLLNSYPMSTISSKYKHIIWDWNGTLLDDSWLCVDVMDGLLTRRNMPGLTLKRYQKVFDFPVIDYYRRLGFDFEKESFEVSGTEFIVEYEKRRHEIQLQPDAKNTLEKVSKMGITQSLLSAYKQKTLEELMDYLAVRQFFIKVIGLDDHYAHSKIESGIQWMAELLSGSECVSSSDESTPRKSQGYSTGEVLFVGDTRHDHEVAEAMGIDCVLIPSGHHTREKLENCGVPLLDSLKDVVVFVR